MTTSIHLRLHHRRLLNRCSMKTSFKGIKSLWYLHDRIRDRLSFLETKRSKTPREIGAIMSKGGVGIQVWLRKTTMKMKVGSNTTASLVEGILVQTILNLTQEWDTRKTEDVSKIIKYPQGMVKNQGRYHRGHYLTLAVEDRFNMGFIRVRIRPNLSKE